jgi:hypothetical protein
VIAIVEFLFALLTGSISLLIEVVGLAFEFIFLCITKGVTEARNTVGKRTKDKHRTVAETTPQNRIPNLIILSVLAVVVCIAFVSLPSLVDVLFG